MLVFATAVFFTLTWFVNQAYQRQRARTAATWFAKGQSDLQSNRPADAQEAFLSALAYAPGNRLYVVNLARALALAGRDREATAYLLGLLQQEPGDGYINLELARLSARNHDLAGAVRYYHGAIYGAWTEDGQRRRRESRLELVHFLLQEHETPQATAELMGLTADLPRDPDAVARAAALFFQTGDNQNALRLFREAIALGSPAPGVLAGAGRAAFRLGQYQAAAEYLRQASEAGADGDASTMRLTANAVLALDPYARGLRQPQRVARAALAFALAGQRLQSCAASSSFSSQAADLQPSWKSLKPRVTSRSLDRDPELQDSVMDEVFRIEQALQSCPAAAPEDVALQLIARERAVPPK